MASINLNSTENDVHESSSEIIIDDKTNHARQEDKWIDVNLNDPQDKRKYDSMPKQQRALSECSAMKSVKIVFADVFTFNSRRSFIGHCLRDSQPNFVDVTNVPSSNELLKRGYTNPKVGVITGHCLSIAARNYD